MAEEVKQAVEALTRAADTNENAKAFLEGLKCGLKYGPKAETEKAGS